MKITVTQDDIDQGKPGNTCACAVGRALRRETGAIWQVFPDLWGGSLKPPLNGIVIRYPFGSEAIRHALPEIVAQFARDFDNSARRHLCKPFRSEWEGLEETK